MIYLYCIYRCVDIQVDIYIQTQHTTYTYVHQIPHMCTKYHICAHIYLYASYSHAHAYIYTPYRPAYVQCASHITYHMHTL